MDYDFELIICLRDLLACLPNPVYLNLRSTPKQPTCAYGDFRGPPPKKKGITGRDLERPTIIGRVFSTFCPNNSQLSESPCSAASRLSRPEAE